MMRNVLTKTKIWNVKKSLKNEVTSEEIEDVYNKHSQKSRLEKLIRLGSNNEESITDRSRRIKVNIPKIKGLPTDRPMKFKKKLENFFYLVKPEDRELFLKQFGTLSKVKSGITQNLLSLLNKDSEMRIFNEQTRKK
ncbi:hypothetical protein TSAR_013918 [Trichomalopsis sarcophagae]|uniref:Uncharacterized protein n=1 Tax=Trichomalopsis sarcophagae TaxID=543379 RepID=A0A232FKP2_9HYME|nr:hypothetical protein TSAR_013918 [Trichomalopsis sarcophagae]